MTMPEGGRAYLLEYRPCSVAMAPAQYMDLPSGIGEWKLKKNETVREAARGEVVSAHYDTYFQGLVQYCDVN